MAGRIDFFCDAHEEGVLLDYVFRERVVVLKPQVSDPSNPPTMSRASLPAWPSAFACYLWLQSAGPLEWHTSAPRLRGDTHGELVANVLAAEAWGRVRPAPGAAICNVDASPLLVYERRGIDGGLVLPSSLVSTASSPEAVSLVYARWIRRVWSWIRRRATRVHDWKEQHPLLRNDSMLLNSVYAFPDSFARLTESPDAYALSVRWERPGT